MTESFPSIWYATPERAARTFKLVVFDDRGWLEASPERLNFSGKKYHLDIENIVSVTLTRQRIAWALYAVTTALGLLWIFTIRQGPLRGDPFFPILLIGSNIYGVLIAFNTRWVLVEYRDEAGEVQKVYLADGSGLGWKGILGGTRRLYTALAERYTR